MSRTRVKKLLMLKCPGIGHLHPVADAALEELIEYALCMDVSILEEGLTGFTSSLIKKHLQTNGFGQHPDPENWIAVYEKELKDVLSKVNNLNIETLEASLETFHCQSVECRKRDNYWAVILEGLDG